MMMTTIAVAASIILLLVGAAPPVLRRLRQGPPPGRDGGDLAELGLGGARRGRRRRRGGRYIVGVRGCGRGGHAISIVVYKTSTKPFFLLLLLHYGVWWRSGRKGVVVVVTMGERERGRRRSICHHRVSNHLSSAKSAQSLPKSARYGTGMSFFNSEIFWRLRDGDSI